MCPCLDPPLYHHKVTNIKIVVADVGLMSPIGCKPFNHSTVLLRITFDSRLDWSSHIYFKDLWKHVILSDVVLINSHVKYLPTTTGRC